MRTLIIYQSKYGSTKQYAEWINQAVESDITDIDNAYRLDLDSYDIIVLGTYFHASHIKMRKFIIKKWDEFKSKKVILFSTSGSPAAYVIEAVHKDLPPMIIDKL
jgi:menaquinone-dependent protoporphyrinogen IX oxidase